MTFKRIATEPAAPKHDERFFCGCCQSTSDYVLIDAGEAVNQEDLRGLAFRVYRRGPGKLLVSPSGPEVVRRLMEMGASGGLVGRAVAKYANQANTGSCPYCGGEEII